MPPRSHEKARVRVTVVASLDSQNNLLEYWWSATPERLRLKNPDTINGNVTVTWEIKGVRLEGNQSIGNFGWDHGGTRQHNGVSMNNDAMVGPVWDDACGTPKKSSSGNTYSLTVTPQHPPGGNERFKYSLFLKVHGKTIVLDPEVEYDEE